MCDADGTNKLEMIATMVMEDLQGMDEVPSWSWANFLTFFLSHSQLGGVFVRDICSRFLTDVVPLLPVYSPYGAEAYLRRAKTFAADVRLRVVSVADPPPQGNHLAVVSDCTLGLSQHSPKVRYTSGPHFCCQLAADFVVCSTTALPCWLYVHVLSRPWVAMMKRFETERQLQLHLPDDVDGRMNLPGGMMAAPALSFCKRKLTQRLCTAKFP